MVIMFPWRELLYYGFVDASDLKLLSKILSFYLQRARKQRRQIIKMKRFFSMALPLAFIIAFFWGLASGQKQSEGQSIPLEVSEYYQNYNFISSFSSQSEREILVDYLDQEKLPEKLKSERLERVFQLMKRIKARVMKFDQKMTIEVKPTGGNIFPSQMIEVRNFKESGGEISVEVASYALKPEENFRFIALYDERKGNEKEISSEDERIETAKSKFPPRIEIHKWLYANGQWMKQEANLVFLKDKKGGEEQK
jgi:hypothetical protein